MAEYQAVIGLHRLAHAEEGFHLNPDLILTIEATPDTIVTLTTHTKLIVSERPRRSSSSSAQWRASILEAGLPRISGAPTCPLHVVRGEHVRSDRGA